MYESQTNAIRWKTRVRMVEKFPYQSKGIVRDRLTRLGGFDVRDPRFTHAPEYGFCLAWKIKAVQLMQLSKPMEITFPRFGWLRLYEENVARWLMPISSAASFLTPRACSRARPSSSAPARRSSRARPASWRRIPDLRPGRDAGRLRRAPGVPRGPRDSRAGDGNAARHRQVSLGRAPGRRSARPAPGSAGESRRVRADVA